jgi:aminoglycoside 6'-N-acetyltransferase I
LFSIKEPLCRIFESNRDKDMSVWRIREVTRSDRQALARMRALLWPGLSPEDHLREVDAVLRNTGTLAAVTLVAQNNEDSAVIGFLEAGLRSHADGCDPAQPVGYVEGWFVLENFRNQGVERDLMRAAENWARSHGCREMASDALIDNAVSQQAHEALGFEVVDRCVHFRKGL